MPRRPGECRGPVTLANLFFQFYALIKRVFLYLYGGNKLPQTPVRRWTPAFAGETTLPVDSAKHIPRLRGESGWGIWSSCVTGITSLFAFQFRIDSPLRDARNIHGKRPHVFTDQLFCQVLSGPCYLDIQNGNIICVFSLIHGFHTTNDGL